MNEELLDIYDENNRPLGVAKPRSVVHQDGSWHKTVHIYVTNDQGQYLVHLRSPHKDLHPGCWNTRLGGHVAKGKSYEETAVEELQQEVGLTVSSKDLISSEIHKSDNGTNREYSKIYFYQFNGELTDLKFNDDEVIEVRWMSPENIIESIRQNPKIWTSTIKSYQSINIIKDTLKDGYIKKWAGALLIEKSGKVILQKRDNNPAILNPGKITLFGGGVEKLETIEDCLKREIKEEVNVDVTNFDYFGLYEKRQVAHGDDCNCYVYLIYDIDINKIKVNEGQGYISISANDNYLTEEYGLITQSVLGDYFKKINKICPKK